MLLNCGIGEDSWESLGLQVDQSSPSWRKWVLNIHWKDWCWSWNSNTLATWCAELTHLKRLWCLETLKVGREGDDRGWDDWMLLSTQWTWVWVDSGSWCWTGRSSMLQSMGSQRVRHNWATELNWTELTPDTSSLEVHACMHAKLLQSCPTETLWTVASQASLSMRVLQARILEWFAMPSSRVSSWPQDGTWVSYICISRRVFHHQHNLQSTLFNCFGEDAALGTYIVF